MKITKNKRKAKNKPQKFMALEVIKSLPMREIDHLLGFIYGSSGSLEGISNQYRRKIQNCRRDDETFTINEEQFICMLLLASHLWPEQYFGQGGLSFSRVYDKQSTYTFQETIIMPHGLNSQYARARQHMHNDGMHKATSLQFVMLHDALIWVQSRLFKELKSRKSRSPNAHLMDFARKILSEL
jgi:hypothetical protein